MPYGTMRPIIQAFLASASLAAASQSVFSVHDDLLAYPQYEVLFSGAYLSDVDASLIIEKASSTAPGTPRNSNTKSLEAQGKAQAPPPTTDNTVDTFDPSKETYELMLLNGEQYLCIIPIVDVPAKNETSEAEARAAEQKELARATDRGWELLQDLGDGECLYFHSGWWSYAFCYNQDITQFHSLPMPAGKPSNVPNRDPNTKQFVLGRAKPTNAKEDEWGRQIEVHKSSQPSQGDTPKTELQVKGDQRYLVQKLEGGTTCDLTGKPRKVEVQYHCNPQVKDRIGYIKEVTTCSYLMVVYTPRLCNDVAFMPPKPDKANPIVCRVVVPEDEIAYYRELASVEAELASHPSSEREKPIIIGGVVVGAGKWVNKEGQRMPVPANFGQDASSIGKTVEVIARAKAKSDGGQVEIISDAELAKLDLDPDMVDQLRKEVQKMAKEKGWKIEVVDQPGQIREILGIVTEDDDDDDDDDGVGAEGKDGEGSEEVFYRDEL